MNPKEMELYFQFTRVSVSRRSQELRDGWQIISWAIVSVLPNEIKYSPFCRCLAIKGNLSSTQLDRFAIGFPTSPPLHLNFNLAKFGPSNFFGL